MRKRPLIFDCDPGTDDAIALMTAFVSEEFDIVAITSVAGNVGIEHTTRNAIQLAELAGVAIPVAQGAAQPLYREQKIAAHVHGANGLRGIELPPTKTTPVGTAIDAIVAAAHKYANELEILAVGPLTNLAHAFLLHPEIIPLIKQIVIMGGGHQVGNATPVAEFNIYADPEAAKIVFEAGIPLYMVGLDVTTARGLTRQETESIFTTINPQTDVIYKILNDRIKAEGAQYPDEAFIHDAMTFLFMVDPTILGGDWYHVDLETKSDISFGKTVVDYYHVTGKHKNCWVALELHYEQYRDLLIDRLRRYQ